MERLGMLGSAVWGRWLRPTERGEKILGREQWMGSSKWMECALARGGVGIVPGGHDPPCLWQKEKDACYGVLFKKDFRAFRVLSWFL
ncbi:MAG: hypothetical protein AAGA58_11935, partial [Verrucomicrobiota bacterium]